jgi:hypothetical protein
MFISNKHLDRRTFLRGVGATVALPLLDAMIPARAYAGVRAVPRLAFVYFPHGAVMNAWTPGSEGRTALGPILEPLAPFARQVTVLSGVENRHAYGPVHAITPGTWLLGTSPREGCRVGDGTTVDQMAANYFAADWPGQASRPTFLRSIEAATEPPREIGTGPWDGVYVKGYGETISVRASEPVSMAVGPRVLFDKVFGLFDGDATPDARRGSSVLDVVAEDAAALPRQLGPRDRAIVRDYLDRIREVERRVDRVETLPLEEAFRERLSLMFALVSLAFRADITRVASCMMAAETSTMTYGHIGVPEPFHLLSHHQNDPAKIESLVRIQRFHTQAFAEFVQALADSPDGDGSLLDRSLILYGSNMSDSYRHDHYPLPLAVVGGGCGALGVGNHVRCPDRTPLSNVLLTLLRRAGLPATSVGDSTGECAGL